VLLWAEAVVDNADRVGIGLGRSVSVTKHRAGGAGTDGMRIRLRGYSREPRIVGLLSKGIWSPTTPSSNTPRRSRVWVNNEVKLFPRTTSPAYPKRCHRDRGEEPKGSQAPLLRERQMKLTLAGHHVRDENRPPYGFRPRLRISMPICATHHAKLTDMTPLLDHVADRPDQGAGRTASGSGKAEG
jgi:hypothetical protein